MCYHAHIQTRTARVLALAICTEAINIRDPYVLAHEGKYYLYGTRSATAWGPASGFDCYVSGDLKRWEGPYEIFHNDGGFWADRCYWAPECYAYGGAFYLIATFRSGERTLGIQPLRASSPLGPFAPYTPGPVTPADMPCLDGTLFVEEGIPWLVFSQSFEQEPRGAMCVMPLSWELDAPAGPIKTIFYAQDAPWATPFPYAKEEFGREGPMYLSDGPAIYKTREDGLLLLWSSFGKDGYTVGVSRSDEGLLNGRWSHLPRPLLEGNGGHGMLFRTLEGRLTYSLHRPNDKGREHPVFLPMEETESGLRPESRKGTE